MISLGHQHVCIDRGTNVHDRLVTFTTVYKRNNGTFYARLTDALGYRYTVELIDKRRAWKQVPFMVKGL